MSSGVTIEALSPVPKMGLTRSHGGDSRMNRLVLVMKVDDI